MWNVLAAASDLVYTWDAPFAVWTLEAIFFFNFQILTALALCNCSHNSYCSTVTTKNICAAIRRQTGDAYINACGAPAAKHFLMHLNRSIIIMTRRFHLKILRFWQSVNSCAWPSDISQKLIWCSWWKWGENQPRHMTRRSSHTVWSLGWFHYQSSPRGGTSTDRALKDAEMWKFPIRTWCRVSVLMKTFRWFWRGSSGRPLCCFFGCTDLSY